MHHLIEFIGNHWFLVASTLVVFVLLIREEAISKGSLGSNLTPQVLTQKINRDNALVVDLRKADAFKAGHIVGSLHLPVDDFDKKMKKLNPHKHRPLVLVCDQGTQAGKFVKPLQEAGFDEVFVLAGGLSAWKRADLPLVSS